MNPSGPSAEAGLKGSAIGRDRIEAVHRLIEPHIRRTPIMSTGGADAGLPPCDLTLKLELLQHAGSFKARGAFAHLLTRPVPDAGVVAASGGNHGAAVAFAARRRGVPAKIFVPSVSSPAKINRIRAYGADLSIVGDSYAEALAASEAWAARTGALMVHAFDQIETILGQGTLALELSQQAPDLDVVLVAVGGGGLIAGIASWYRRNVRVIGVEPVSAPTLTEALKAGRPVDAPTGGIAADSLSPSRVGSLVLPIAQAFVDRVLLVADEDIRRAQQTIWDRFRLVAEPGGSAAFAALQSGAYQPEPTERVAIVLSGGNTTAVDFGRR